MRALIQRAFGGVIAYRLAYATYLLAVAAATVSIASAWSADTRVTVTIVCTGLALLGAVPRRPLLALYVYVVLAYGFPRYTTGVEFIYAHFVPELVAALAAFGTVLWIVRDRTPSTLNPTLPWVMILLVGWSLLSAIVALTSSSDWFDLRATFDLKHHPGRLVNAALLMFTATLAMRTRLEFMRFALFASIVLIVKWSLFEDDIRARPGDFAALAVMIIPLAGGIAIVARSTAMKIAGWLPPLILVGLVFATANRGAVVALVFVAIALLLQARQKRKALLIAAPLFAAAIVAFQWSGVGMRFEGLPGSSAGTVDAGVHERLALWAAVPGIVADHWLLGVGPGRSPQYLARYTPENVNADYATHNNLMAVAAELGLPGLMLYLALFAGAIIALWQRGGVSDRTWPAPEARLLAASLVGYLAVGLFITRHDQALAYILVGIAIALTGRHQHRPLPGDDRANGRA